MSYAEHPEPNPVAVKRMGDYIILVQRTLHEQPDMLMLKVDGVRELIAQLQGLLSHEA